MPTAPDPNSPYMDSRLEAEMGIRAPGGPSSAGKPGPQAGDLSFPAPPAVASAPPGRPAGPTAPAPAPAVAPKPAAVQAGQPAAAEAAAAPLPPTPAPADLPIDGSPVASTLGTASRDAAGNPQLALSPEGDMRYRQAVIAGREKLGPIPSIFRNPALPEMPFELGQHNYNPFTGSWHKE